MSPRLVSHLLAPCLLLFACAPAAAKDIPFRVELPDGATIELVGLNESPAGSGSWWRPDGTPLAKPPEGEAKDFVGPEADSIARAIALEIVTDGTATVSGPGPGGPTWLGQSSGAPITKKMGGRVLEKRQIVAKLPPNARTTIVVDYAGGPWKTVAQTGRKGAGGTGQPGKWGVVWDQASDENGAARIAAAYDVGGDFSRIVAIDEENHEHLSAPRGGSSVGNASLLSARFPGLPVARVREFRFQTRPFNHHIEFRNVSVHRGQKSPVQIYLDGQRYVPKQTSAVVHPSPIKPDRRRFFTEGKEATGKKSAAGISPFSVTSVSSCSIFGLLHFLGVL